MLIQFFKSKNSFLSIIMFPDLMVALSFICGPQEKVNNLHWCCWCWGSGALAILVSVTDCGWMTPWSNNLTCITPCLTTDLWKDVEYFHFFWWLWVLILGILGLRHHSPWVRRSGTNETRGDPIKSTTKTISITNTIKSSLTSLLLLEVKPLR